MAANQKENHMKRMLAVLAILALSSGAVWANGLGVFGSYWTPADADAGFGAGAKLQVDFSDFLALELRGGYYPDMSEDMGPLELDLQIIPIEADLIAKIPLGPIHLYGGAGAGYYMLDADYSVMGGSGSIDIDDEVGWFALGGIEVAPVEALALFFEVKYTYIKGTVQNDDVDTIVGGVDLDLSGLSANAGVMLTW